MRVIDADKLEPTAVLALQLQHANSRYYYFYEEETIKNAPTVEVIPKEWIRKYTLRPISDSDYWAIIRMFKEWERENGTEETW